MGIPYKNTEGVLAGCGRFWEVAIQSEGTPGSLFLPMWPKSRLWITFANEIGQRMLHDKEFAEDAKVGDAACSTTRNLRRTRRYES